MDCPSFCVWAISGRVLLMYRTCVYSGGTCWWTVCYCLQDAVPVESEAGRDESKCKGRIWEPLLFHASLWDNSKWSISHTPSQLSHFTSPSNMCTNHDNLIQFYLNISWKNCRFIILRGTSRVSLYPWQLWGKICWENLLNYTAIV